MKEINREKILTYVIGVLGIFFILGLISLFVYGNAYKNEEYDCMSPSSTFYKCSVRILQLYTLLIMVMLGGISMLRFY